MTDYLGDSEAVIDAFSLTQQTCPAPDQLFKVVCRDAQANHLRVERQFLRRALQQFEQGLGRTRAS